MLPSPIRLITSTLIPFLSVHSSPLSVLIQPGNLQKSVLPVYHPSVLLVVTHFYCYPAYWGVKECFDFQ